MAWIASLLKIRREARVEILGGAPVTVLTFWPHCVEDSRFSGDADQTRRSKRVSFMRSTALAKSSEKPPFSATGGTQPLFARCKLETEMEPQ
jgi:hypothetical protein